MRYGIRVTTQFKCDVKLAQRRGYNMDLLTQAIELLADGQPMPEQYRDHALSGNYAGHRECHIQTDWLLVYKKLDKEIILELVRNGTHSDLFKK